MQPAALELMRSYATTPTQVLRKVRIPNMLPFFFTALKVSTTLAFIGAIVGEYFGGASRVIGKVVMSSMANGSFDLAWAGIVIGASGAIVAYLVVSLVERFTIPWYAALRVGRAVDRRARSRPAVVWGIVLPSRRGAARIPERRNGPSGDGSERSGVRCCS